MAMQSEMIQTIFSQLLIDLNSFVGSPCHIIHVEFGAPNSKVQS